MVLIMGLMLIAGQDSAVNLIRRVVRMCECNYIWGGECGVYIGVMVTMLISLSVEGDRLLISWIVGGGGFNRNN